MTGTLRYHISLAGLCVSIAMFLVTIVDTRRAFLGFPYFLSSAWINLSYWHIPFLLIGVWGMWFFRSKLSRVEGASHFSEQQLSGWSRKFLWLLFIILVVDLLFLYRGVAMTRIALAGKIKAPLASVFTATAEVFSYGSSSPLMSVLALAVNYLAAVWHATFVGLCLASLSMLGLPTVFVGRLGGSGRLSAVLSGVLWALPQPFCSCCASPIAAAMIKGGSTIASSMSFLLASPMLNITGLFLAIMLLPLKFAVLRITAGLLLALPIAYLLALFLDRYGPKKWQDDTKFRRNGLFGRYCNLFQIEEEVIGNAWKSPARAFDVWIVVLWKLTKATIPALILGSLLASVFAVLLGPTLANNFIGVLVAAAVGSVLMIATWTEIPLVAIMAAAGMSAPAAALLVTLPAVSLPCLLILASALRNVWVAVLLGMTVFILGVLSGLLFL